METFSQRSSYSDVSYCRDDKEFSDLLDENKAEKIFGSLKFKAEKM